MGALDGIRILDLSRILAGPWATQMLADLGADVVKVEAEWGDDTRKWGPPFIGDDAAYFHSCNRGKRSMVLDLKSEESIQILHQLIDCADVVVENFRAGTLEKWGVHPEKFDGKILCRITGYGQTGPRASEPGYDIALQAMTGIMSVTGNADGEPAKVGVAWIDVLTGMMAGNGILAALFHRERTGEGQIIDLSLFDVALMAMVNQAQGGLPLEKIQLEWVMHTRTSSPTKHSKPKTIGSFSLVAMILSSRVFVRSRRPVNSCDRNLRRIPALGGPQ